MFKDPSLQIFSQVIIATFIWLASTAQSSAQDYRLGNAINPLHQSVALSLDPSQKGFAGSTEITISLNQATNKIRLYQKGLINLKAALTNTHDKQTLNLAVGSTNDFDILELISPEPLNKGHYRLKIEFSGLYSSRSEGLYQFNEAGIDYLATQFQAMKARTVFPSFDEPEFKIPFEFILTVPKGLDVLANTSVKNVSLAGDHAIHTFKQTAAINTDVLAFAVGQFEQMVVEGLPVSSSILVTKGKLDKTKDIAEAIGPLFHRISDFFKAEYPYEKLDFLVLPHYGGAGMENVGLVTLNEDWVLVSNSKAKGDLYEMHKLVAHEIAHMWFGNLVTMRWWDDLWLNESFAEWLARKIVLEHFEEVGGELELPQLSAFWNDGPDNPPIKREMQSVADYNAVGQIVYSKGHALIAMVEQYVGKAKFRQAMIDYIANFSHQNVSYAEFITHLESHTKKPLKGIFNSFLTQSGYPLVTLSLSGKKLTLAQQPFSSTKNNAKDDAGNVSSDLLWHIPLKLKFFSQESITTRSVLLDQAEKVVLVPEGTTYVFADTNGLGYFRYKVNAHQDSSLRFNRLSDKEQKSLIANMSDLVSGGYLNYVELLNLQVKLVGTADTNVQIASDTVTELINGFEEVVPVSLHQGYVDYLTKELSALRSNIQWQQDTNDNLQYVGFKAKLLGLFGGYLADKKAIGFATTNYQKVLLGTSSLSEPWQKAVLNVMASVSGPSVFNQFKAAYISSKNEAHKAEILRYMGAFSYNGAVSHYYDFLFSKHVVEKNFKGYYFQYPVFNPINRLAAINYFQYGVGKLFDRVSEEEKQWQPYSFARACSSKVKAKLNTVFSPFVDEIKGLKEKLTNVNNMIEQCTQTQQKNQAALSRLFNTKD